MAASDLVISVGANIQELERQLKASAKVAEQAADDIEAKFKKANPTISTSALTGALKGFAAAFTLDKVIRGLADANAELVRIGETAKRVGLDLQRFQELQFAGRSNGLSSKDFGTGLEGLAEKLNEARQSENGLSKLFDDNNVKLKDRKGEVIGVNDALGQVANLVRNAATEFDKIKIAETVGLTRDWVPLLEQGAEAINRQASAARAAGAVIDSDVIQKAKDFERDWSAAIQRWTTLFQANAGVIIGMIDTIIDKASGLFAGLDRYSKGLQAKADLEANGAAGASRSTIDYAQREFKASGQALPKELQDRLDQLNEFEREANRGRSVAPLQVTVPGGRKTDTSSFYNKGRGGGSSGQSDEEKAQDRLDRYIESLARQRDVMEAEIATFGRSNAEKKAAIEIAKAQVDLEKLSADEKANYIAKLTEEVTKNEEVRASKERLQDAQKGLNDAQKYFGNAAVDALEDLIVNGAKAEDVMKRLAASLVKAALQAALLGQGPLAGVFGTAGTGGNVGGLVGGLINFGRASGGGVNAGQAYRVGERGPETFVPTTPGKIVPAGRGGGGLVVNVTNNTPAQVETRPRSDGGFDMIIDQIDGALAQRSLHGQGALTTAFAARSTGRHLRG